VSKPSCTKLVEPGCDEGAARVENHLVGETPQPTGTLLTTSPRISSRKIFWFLWQGG